MKLYYVRKPNGIWLKTTFHAYGVIYELMGLYPWRFEGYAIAEDWTPRPS